MAAVPVRTGHKEVLNQFAILILIFLFPYFKYLKRSKSQLCSEKQTVRITLSVSSFHGSNETEAAHSRTGPEIVEVLGSKIVASFSVEKLAT